MTKHPVWGGRRTEGCENGAKLARDIRHAAHVSQQAGFVWSLCKMHHIKRLSEQWMMRGKVFAAFSSSLTLASYWLGIKIIKFTVWLKGYWLWSWNVFLDDNQCIRSIIQSLIHSLSSTTSTAYPAEGHWKKFFISALLHTLSVSDDRIFIYTDFNWIMPISECFALCLREQCSH